jgi:PAS domain S-box-containing protein
MTGTDDVRPPGGGHSALPLGSDEEFRLLVQAVTDYAIYLLTPDGLVATWNQGVRRIKGYEAGDVIGRHFSMFYTAEDRAAGAPNTALSTAAAEGRYEGEGWRVCKDGTTFWASVIIDRIQGDDGRLVGFAKITRDITERMMAQRAFEQMQAAFVQAQKMEAVGQLTGGIAHDFNNLLTVIASNADLLAQPRLEDRDKHALIEGIQRAADRGARLTQQLLAFARRQPLRPAIHSVRALVRNFEAVLRRGAGEWVEVALELAKEPDFTRIDGPQFEAALLNLIVNARDAMPDHGKITLRTTLAAVADPRALGVPDLPTGDYVVLSIADTGTGMAPDTVARAFEPFFTTKEPGKGSGLGLSQVYGFVRQSGGDVRIESNLGSGTTIFLYLPVDAEAQQKAQQEDRQAGAGGPRTVLLVEDDPDVMTSAVAMLKSLGYDVLTAADATAALETLDRESGIDILFTDVVMPKGLSGVDLARRARAQRADLKILLASGYPMSALSAQHGLGDDFAFLSKPYRWAELSERLRGLRPAG